MPRFHIFILMWFLEIKGNLVLRVNFGRLMNEQKYFFSTLITFDVSRREVKFWGKNCPQQHCGLFLSGSSSSEIWHAASKNRTSKRWLNFLVLHPGWSMEGSVFSSTFLSLVISDQRNNFTQNFGVKSIRAKIFSSLSSHYDCIFRFLISPRDKRFQENRIKNYSQKKLSFHE